MKIKKILSPFLKGIVAVAAVTGLYLFCEGKTHGFRPYLILSNLPSDPRWEVPPLSDKEQQEVNALLDQRFKFLGSGGWCFAFLGEDGKTVLKFYRHSQFLPTTLLTEFSLGKLFLKSPRLPIDSSYFQEFNFKSCTLLYKEAKERTGILYVHLNKTEKLHKPVTLIDNVGVAHTIDLDNTEFVVQKRADLLLSHLHKLAKNKKTEEAKECIDDMLNCLLSLYKKGIRDYDHSLRNNFGYIDGKAVTLDLSSFGPDESLKRPGEYKKELVVKTRRMSRFLEKNHSDLSAYFENRLTEIIETDGLTDGKAL